MKPEFRHLRIAQLDQTLRPFLGLKAAARPQRGWIRAIREATGLSMAAIAARMGKSQPLVARLEKSEAEYRITLASLRDAADALGCQLVYALIPKSGTLEELAEQSARTKAAENVRAVEHTMALEDQAVGGVEQKIEQETKRLLRKTK